MRPLLLAMLDAAAPYMSITAYILSLLITLSAAAAADTLPLLFIDDAARHAAIAHRRVLPLRDIFALIFATLRAAISAFRHAIAAAPLIAADFRSRRHCCCHTLR